VLDLPSGAQATSPPFCITSDYLKSRMFVRNVAGSEGVFLFVSYLRNGEWSRPKNTGQFHGDKSAWTLSGGMNIQPNGHPGWQQARFTFVAGGTKSHFTNVGAIVRASHEEFDGSGYPDGLAGDAIPIEARICSVCDAFSAMTTDRPYRDAMSAPLALAELRRCAGAQFDPAVVAAFERVMERSAA
jgi:hypothetical protein